MKRCLPNGFTLIEILAVISIIAIITALIFPVFAQTKRKAHETVCMSNLRQIGMAVAMYAQDNDDRFPVGSDSKDGYSFLYYPEPEESTTISIMKTMPVVRDLLSPYIGNKMIWDCPADKISFKTTFYTRDGDSEDVLISPTAFDRLGTSYLYRLNLGLKGISYPGHCPDSSGPEAGNASIGGPALFVDATPRWHGDSEPDGIKRMNILYSDGHVKSGDSTRFLYSWLCIAQ